MEKAGSYIYNAQNEKIFCLRLRDYKSFSFVQTQIEVGKSRIIRGIAC